MYSDEEKFFIGLFLTIARKEHKAPAEVEQWSLPDVVHMYASYIDEAKEMENLTKDIPKE